MQLNISVILTGFSLIIFTVCLRVGIQLFFLIIVIDNNCSVHFSEYSSEHAFSCKQWVSQ